VTNFFKPDEQLIPKVKYYQYFNKLFPLQSTVICISKSKFSKREKETERTEIISAYNFLLILAKRAKLKVALNFLLLH
jgi:hypothetical protein